MRIDNVIQKSKCDAWCNQMLHQVEETTPAYLAIREQLPKEAQVQLDQYISACEEYWYAIAVLACEISQDR